MFLLMVASQKRNHYYNAFFRHASTGKTMIKPDAIIPWGSRKSPAAARDAVFLGMRVNPPEDRRQNA
jgi:hypothetical protein